MVGRSETQAYEQTSAHEPGFVPSEEDVSSVLEWFARYDAHALEADVERMADMALFPLNSVTDDESGNGSAEISDRDEYVRQMREVLDGTADVSMESTRTPHFLNENLVFVVTDGTITANGDTHTVRYGDLLVKVEGDWRFQTMVQGGWK